MPQTKEEKSIYDKERYNMNKAKKINHNAVYYEKNKEVIKQKRKVKYENNKEKFNEMRRIKYENNKIEINKKRKENVQKETEYQRKYRTTKKGQYVSVIGRWKHSGLIGNYEEIYDKYINCNNCEECNCEFSTIGDGVGRWKCMDHDHITGLFRNVLCNVCNIRRG